MHAHLFEFEKWLRRRITQELIEERVVLMSCIRVWRVASSVPWVERQHVLSSHDLDEEHPAFPYAAACQFLTLKYRVSETVHHNYLKSFYSMLYEDWRNAYAVPPLHADRRRPL